MFALGSGAGHLTLLGVVIAAVAIFAVIWIVQWFEDRD